MAEFKLGRIRFVYQGSWTTGALYSVDDVVTNGGKTYICVVSHTAAPLFATDLAVVPSKWKIVADGVHWTGNWASSTYYNSGDLVKYGGIVYQCNTAHTSATYVSPTWLGLEADSIRWDAFATTTDWKGSWVTSTRYKKNDVVSYGGYVYLCNAPHISNSSATAGLEADSSNWDTFNAGIVYLGVWNSSTVRYKQNDVVKYGADLWICTTYHTSSATFDQTKWSVFVNGFQFESSWNSSTVYQIGDTVTYGGYSYIAKTNNTNKQPSQNASDWDVYTTGFSYKGDWANSTAYKNGEVVRLDGYTYLCTTDTVTLSNTITASTSGSPGVLTTSTNTTGFVAGMAVVFTGSTFGGIVANRTYYIVSGFTSTQFSVSDLPGGSAVTLSTTTGSMTATTAPQPPNSSYWTRLNSGLKWTNNAQTYTGTSGTAVSATGIVAVATGTGSTQIVLTGTPAIYTGILVTGTNIQTGTTVTAIAGNIITLSLATSGAVAKDASLSFGSAFGSSATFNVTRTGTVYTVALNATGTNYGIGHQIKIAGTSIGGQSPVNDLIVTVTGVSGSAISTFTFTGISVTWTANISYVLGDVVFYGANSYICIQAHTAATASRPDNDTTGTYWNLLSAGAEVATLTSAGDTFYYGPNGPQRLPIGADGQVLRSTNGYPAWSNFGVVNNLVYVGPLGVDSAYPDYGLTIDRPWKTIRFATKQIENGYLNPQAQQLLAKNKQFLMKEVTNYITYTYKVTVTGTSSNAFTTSNTAGIVPNMPIQFSALTGSLTLSGSAIDTSVVYYVKTIVANTSFTVSATISNGVAGTQVNAAGTGTSTASLSYNSTKCERDTGLIVDALIFDIGHNGTQKTTAAALSYYTTAGTAYITTNFGYQATQTAGAYTYLNTIVGNVLANVAPAVNYQSLNSVSTPATQIIDTTLTAESSTSATATGLISIITTGILGASSTAIPAVINPQTTISIKTGTYNEILPIVIPSYTALVGDELRSTVIQPATANTMLVNDKTKTIAALNRIKAIIPTLVSNGTVTPSTGNTQLQVTSLPAGDTGSTTAVTNAVASATELYDVVNSGYAGVSTFVLPQPTGYNTSYLVGYGDGKAQIIQNYQFIKADILQYIANNYPSVYSAMDKTLCSRDVGFILDALQFDMTYGGNFQTLIAGSSYYSNYLITIAGTEKTATLAAYAQLKTLIGQVVLKSGVSPQAGNSVPWIQTGTAGSAGASTFAQARIQDIIDWITNAYAPTAIAPSITWTAAGLQTAYAAVQAKRSEIQSDAVAWVKKYYQALPFNSVTCSRDAGLITDAICYDMVFGSNVCAIVAGRSYLRNTSSAALVYASQKAAELGAINFIKYKVKHIAASGSVAQLQTNIDDITAYISGGSTPMIAWPNPSLLTTTYSTVAGTNIVGTGSSGTFNITRTVTGAYSITIAASGSGYSAGNTIKILGTQVGGVSPTNDFVITVASVSTGAITSVTYADALSGIILLQDNKAYLQAEISAYLNTNYNSVWTGLGTTGQAKCTRDVGYLVDALCYDLKYGGNYASKQAAKTYYSNASLVIAAGELTATVAAYGRLSTAAQQVLQSTSVTPSSGNTATQVVANGAQPSGSSLTATALGTLVTMINNIITNGTTTGVPTVTITTIATGTTFTTGSAHGLVVGDTVYAQSTANGLVAGTTYYVASTPLTTTFTLSATYGSAALTSFTSGTGLSIVVETTYMPNTAWVDSNLVTQYTTLSAAKSTLQTAVTTYLTTAYPTLVYTTATCQRDVGYIVDAICLDLMFNSTFATVKSGQAYFRYIASDLIVLNTERAQTIAAFAYLKSQIATTISTNTTAVARANAGMETIINILTNGDGVTPEVHGTVTYNNTLSTINGVEIIRANKTFLTYEATAYISATFGGTVTYTTSGTNLITTTSAHNLSVGDPVQFTATTVNTIATATNTSGNLITVASTAGMVVNMPITFTGTTANGISSGTQFYIKTIPTPGVNGTITISATQSNGVAGTVQSITTTGAVSFTVVAGGLFGGVSAIDQTTGATKTYYVLTAPSTTTFSVTATQNSSTVVTLTDAGGVATATYGYNATLCRRDMAEYIDALVYDAQYVGNYRGLRAAQIYNNAITGSATQDMFRVRNATGLRNCTLNGLTGTLTYPNSYGTKRPTAGAFVALDPGFGPNDSNVWVTTRSHYSQNVTMFGTACSGAKIDSALHTGGNKSMVKNDFTTIISDGIGVWVTGSGALTELVSVFNYYGYAGYLAELGGRIRATNGNSSYGTYGVIAEGVDSYETPLYATLNNRANPAQISLALTDSLDKLLRFEYSNAGSNYTNTVHSISGAGYNAAAIGDEFRDASIFETRVVDLNDTNGYGGAGYLTAANTAQNGNVGYVTIAAADTQLSTAYVGMRIQVTAGTGVGQYANILTYGNGSKIATIYKDSFTTLTVTATTAGGNNLLTVASTATLYVGMPIYLGSDIGGLTAATVYYVIAANFSATQFAVSTSAGGSAAPTTLTSGQTVSLYAAGWDHVIPGNTVNNLLDLTSTYIIEPRLSYTAPGFVSSARTLSATTTWGSVTYGANRFVTISSNGTATGYSTDGKSWSAGGNSPINTTWADIKYGGGEGATAYAVIGGIGGQSAVFQAVLGTAGGAILADQVASVNIISGGFGYVTAPTIVFTPVSGGSGAVATCTVLNGSITSVSITIPGSGYTVAPTVSAAVDRVTSFPVLTWGKNYATAPTVTVDDPFTGTLWTSGGSATLNTIYYYTSSNVKNWYKCTSAGTFTSSGPTHTSGSTTNGTATLLFIGNTAIATASLTNSGVSNIAVTNSGSGYTSTPSVTIVDSNAKFVAIPTTGNANTIYNTVSGIASTWSQSATVIPTGTYASLAVGGTYYVAVGGSASAARSTDGSNWTSSTIPTLGSGSWSSIAYGNSTFVAIATGSNVTAVSSNSGASWAQGGTTSGYTTMPSSTTWTSIAYGNGRFVALAVTGAVAYSLDKAASWTASPTCAGASTSILSSSYTWSKIAYGQGLFMAIAQGTTVCATSPDGINWTIQAMPSSSNWKGLVFGNPVNATLGATPLFVAVSNTSGTVGASIRTGAKTLGRVTIKSNAITEVRMIEPGSGYAKGIVTATTASTNLITVDNTDGTGTATLVDSQPIEFTGVTAGGLVLNKTYYVIGSTITSTQFKVSATAGSATAATLTTATGLTGTFRAGPILTQTDPNKTKTAPLRVRQGDGALGNPTFTNRGSANTTATASTAGDGYGDLYQPSNFINAANLYAVPLPGANLEFASLPGQYYKLVAVSNILGGAGNYTATIQINPALTVYQAPANGDLITTRLKYSQVRLTGHDFLYIGTGGFAATNYPYVDTSKAVTANQANFSGGGRVFFTSTDQDGNFNVGNLFGVQQATGTATLNASAFNLSGLQSLQLGTVSVGAGSAVITSFSTDPYFTANSDNILPTQRAIKSYITAQIGGGQSALNVNTLTAGVIYVANNTISTNNGTQINVTAKMNFTGGIDGAPVALAFFMQR
ncbi:ChiC_BD domain containing protein [uncultured Caudovirales phage]|uniref:ChiC_BD domain containing protein n=1 Tax=uncultured Caudovirales phage TaxID=2100421 RepID=A0A6J7WHK8_9CAUD|nr:ChiC_BD domain containing protein [uncultured Caudovirales phage]CAB5209214.1 ChiC_BD domain containing protein [uncultured Caudovirales phage]